VQKDKRGRRFYLISAIPCVNIDKKEDKVFLFKRKLSDICERAMRAGRRIDLKGCNYGETDGCCRFVARPTNYYYFLAGLVKSEGLTTILESGTHCGGSIMSMSRGIRSRHIAKSKIVTIDVTYKNDEGFRGYPHIMRLQGDAASDSVVEKVVGVFKRPLDLFYVDSAHEYGHTKKTIDLYSRRLRPKYIALDDIRLSGEMKRFWRELVDKFCDNAFDASEIVGRKKAGFGIIRWSEQTK